MAEDVLFEFLHMEIVNFMYDSSAANDEQVTRSIGRVRRKSRKMTKIAVNSGNSDKIGANSRHQISYSYLSLKHYLGLWCT